MDVEEMKARAYDLRLEIEAAEKAAETHAAAAKEARKAKKEADDKVDSLKAELAKIEGDIAGAKDAA